MAVRIGFGDETEYIENEELEEEKEKERSFHPEKKLSVYIPEKRVAQFMADYDCVVVQDYGDDYHLSDEERLEKNKSYEIFRNFSRCKHKYRRVDQYVHAMREFLKCLDYVAEHNKVYDPEEFKVMYLKDKIFITGLFIPKFVGKDKKSIDSEYLTDFILSDEDPSILLRKKGVDTVYTDEDLEEMSKYLFTDDQLNRYLAPLTEEEEIESLTTFDEDSSKIGINLVSELSNKDMKKLIKSTPEFLTIFKDAKDSQKSIANMASYAYDINMDDLDRIARYDRKHNIVSTGSVPEFTGDISNDDDYNRYMALLQEWEKDNVFDNYHGKIKSLGEIEDLELKTFLERNGWEIRNLYGNKEKEKLLKKQRLEDKKKEKRLRQKLKAIDIRRKRRMGDEPIEIKEKKKKSKKGKSKAVKEEKKRLKNTMNDFMDASTNTDKMTLDWTKF